MMSESKMIFIENKDIYAIRYDDIIYMEYMDRNVYIHTKENEVIKRNICLKKLLQEVDGNDFIQVYRSIVVNLRYVKKVIENEIYLYGTEKILPISRKFRKEIAKLLFDDNINIKNADS